MTKQELIDAGFKVGEISHQDDPDTRAILMIGEPLR